MPLLRRQDVNRLTCQLRGLLQRCDKPLQCGMQVVAQAVRADTMINLCRKNKVLSRVVDRHRKWVVSTSPALQNLDALPTELFRVSNRTRSPIVENCREQRGWGHHTAATLRQGQ